jgi:hypothetical protein
MAGMKLFESRLVEFCYRQSTPLEPVAEIHYSAYLVVKVPEA